MISSIWIRNCSHGALHYWVTVLQLYNYLAQCLIGFAVAPHFFVDEKINRFPLLACNYYQAARTWLTTLHEWKHVEMKYDSNILQNDVATYLWYQLGRLWPKSSAQWIAVTLLSHQQNIKLSQRMLVSRQDRRQHWTQQYAQQESRRGTRKPYFTYGNKRNWQHHEQIVRT